MSDTILASNTQCEACKKMPVDDPVTKRERRWRRCRIENIKFTIYPGGFWEWEKPCGLALVANMMM